MGKCLRQRPRPKKAGAVGIESISATVGVCVEMEGGEVHRDTVRVEVLTGSGAPERRWLALEVVLEAVRRHAATVRDGRCAGCGRRDDG